MSLVCQKTFIQRVVSNPGFYAYYKCEEVADPIVDQVAAVNLTSTGAVVSAPGIIGQGFNINNWEAESANTDKFNFLAHDFTIRMWVKMTDPTSSQFSMLENNSVDYSWELYMTRYNYQMGPRWSVYDSTSTQFIINRNVFLSAGWHRIIAWVKKGVEIGMRIDNAGATDYWQSTTPMTNDIYDPGLVNSGLFVANGTSGFNDWIDEIAIWDRILTDAEMTTDWNGGAGTTYPTI